MGKGDRPREQRGREPRGSDGLGFQYIWDEHPATARDRMKRFVGREIIIKYYKERPRSRLVPMTGEKRVRGRLTKVEFSHGALMAYVESVTGVNVTIPVIFIYSIELWIPGWSDKPTDPPPPRRPI